MSCQRLPAIAALFMWMTIQLSTSAELYVRNDDSYRSKTCPANDTVCQSAMEGNREPAKILETINTLYGEPQVVLSYLTSETKAILQQTNDYITQYESWKYHCQNRHHLCSYWAANGECDVNKAYMKLYCAPSCQLCEVPSNKNPQQSLQHLQVTLPESQPGILVSTAFGESQFIPNVNADPVVQILSNATMYMKRVFSEEQFSSVRSTCKNKDYRCSFWASRGECQKNPRYMSISCAPVCRTCEQITYDYRCPYNKSAATVWQPGDLDQAFKRIIEGFTQFHPTVLSNPPDGPWILQLDNFVTGLECDRLIQYGYQKGYNASVTAGRMLPDGNAEEGNPKNPVRTSMNTWCQTECEDDPIIASLLKRIDEVLQIPRNNSEPLQLLSYNPGQFYRRHHDFLDKDQNRPQGPRILTLFMYLNDVDAGGETNFPHLGLSVKPRKGRAILWPNVLDENPNTNDFRTEHEAMSVIQGKKFAANAWIHQKDYRTPHFANCA